MKSQTHFCYALFNDDADHDINWMNSHHSKVTRTRVPDTKKDWTGTVSRFRVSRDLINHINKCFHPANKARSPNDLEGMSNSIITYANSITDVKLQNQLMKLQRKLIEPHTTKQATKYDKSTKISYHLRSVLFTQ